MNHAGDLYTSHYSIVNNILIIETPQRNPMCTQPQMNCFVSCVVHESQQEVRKFYFQSLVPESIQVWISSHGNSCVFWFSSIWSWRLLPYTAHTAASAMRERERQRVCVCMCVCACTQRACLSFLFLVLAVVAAFVKILLLIVLIMVLT